jgi:hypothetical protein
MNPLDDFMAAEFPQAPHHVARVGDVATDLSAVPDGAAKAGVPDRDRLQQQAVHR